MVYATKETSDDAVIRDVLENGKCRQKSTGEEREKLFDELHDKANQDGLYWRAIFAVLIGGDEKKFSSSDDLTPDRIKEIYDRIGPVPEKFKDVPPQIYYNGLRAQIKKKWMLQSVHPTLMQDRSMIFIIMPLT